MTMKLVTLLSKFQVLFLLERKIAFAFADFAQCEHTLSTVPYIDISGGIYDDEAAAHSSGRCSQLCRTDSNTNHRRDNKKKTTTESRIIQRGFKTGKGGGGRHCRLIKIQQKIYKKFRDFTKD